MLSGLGPDASLWAALGVAVAMALVFALSRRRYLSMPEMRRREAGTPDCMVVIPARDEAAFIGRAVASLPADTVIVVDDHSTDRTAEVAAQAGAGVLRAPDLPRGAVGKPNACMAGARLLTSKWVLFTDADAWFEPGFLESLVGYAETNGQAMVSLYLRAEHHTLAERMLGPYAAALDFFGISFSRDPAASFRGQCVLVLREPYEFLGGHGAMLKTLSDDVRMAALAKRHRLKFSSVRAETLGHAWVREPVAAFRRSAFRFLLLSSWIGAGVTLAALVSALWLPALAELLVNREWLAAAVFALLPSALTLGWYRSPARALLAPLAIYAMPWVIFRGLWGAIAGKPVKWKGRMV